MFGTVRRRAVSMACRRQIRRMSTIQVASKPNPVSLLINQYKPSSMPRVPLTDPVLPSVALPTHTTAISREAPRISTLPNGVKVVSSNHASPVASVAVLLNVGSRMEPPKIAGISNFISSMALGTTANNSEYLISQTLARHGISLSTSTTKESTMYVTHTLHKHLPLALDLISDSIFRLSFSLDDVNIAKAHQREVLEEQAKAGTVDYSELIHKAAYGNATLGLPVVGDENSLESLTPDVLTAFTKTFWRPSNIVIAGLGVDHDSLTGLASRFFNQKDTITDPRTKALLTPKQAKYKGGDLRTFQPTGSAHIMLGFETASWKNEKEVYAMSVLQQLMGGGESFSAGGPGKGMYSRLYTNILNRHSWAQSASASNAIYSDSGLFFLYGNCPPQRARKMLAALSVEAVNMLKVTEEEVERAKNQLQNNVLMQMEARDVQVEDLAKQVQLFGKVDSEDHLISSVRKVTVKEVRAAAVRMLLSPISFAAHGEFYKLPTAEEIRLSIAKASGLADLAKKYDEFQKSQQQQ